MNMRTPHLIVDAQVAMGFVVQQAAYVEQQVNETVYPDIIYDQLVPIDNGANPFARTVTYYSSDKFGKADWINGNADDIPIAGTDRARFETAIHTAAIGYAWGWQEVNEAVMYGINLQAEDALAARRAYEEMCQLVAFRGDASKGFNGLINYPGITITAAPAAITNDTPVDEVVATLNSFLMATRTATGGTSMADTLLLPPSTLNILATRRLGETALTILQFFRDNNSYTAITRQPLDVRGLEELETAGAGNTKRAIAYRRNPQVVKMHVPMPHRFLPVYQDGPLHWLVPGVFRLGGVDVRRPAEFRYMDGL